MKCKGENCSAEAGIGHSSECLSEHEKTISIGAGNRNPVARYRGYKGEPLDTKATLDEIAAWHEGDRARIL